MQDKNTNKNSEDTQKILREIRDTLFELKISINKRKNEWARGKVEQVLSPYVVDLREKRESSEPKENTVIIKSDESKYNFLESFEEPERKQQAVEYRKIPKFKHKSIFRPNFIKHELKESEAVRVVPKRSKNKWRLPKFSFGFWTNLYRLVYLTGLLVAKLFGYQKKWVDLIFSKITHLPSALSNQQIATTLVTKL